MPEDQPEAVHGDACAEIHSVRQRHRDHVPSGIDATDVDRPVLLPRLRGNPLRLPTVDRLPHAFRHALSVTVGHQPTERHIHLGRITE